MELTTQAISPKIVIIKVNGALNARSAEDFKQICRDLVNKGFADLIVDMEGVPFVDSSGLASLVSGLKTVGGDAQRFRLTFPQSQMRLLAENTMFDRVFQIFDTTKDALEELTIELLESVGSYFRSIGDFALAITYFRRVLAIYTIIGNMDSRRAYTLCKLADMLLQQGADISQPTVLYREALAIYEDRLEPDSTTIDEIQDILRKLDSGDIEAMVSKDPPQTEQPFVSPQSQLALADQITTLGQLLKLQGDDEEANAEFVLADQIRAAVSGSPAAEPPSDDALNT